MPPRLTVAQLAAAAQANGIDPAALNAVVVVETGGKGGFLPNGWVRVLFERHLLWRQLLIRTIDPYPLAKARPDLCGSKWDPKRYPYGSEVGQWDRVAGVITWGQRNDPDHWESYKKAAYESCSWGLFQLMGYHYLDLGYANVYDFKHAQEESEARQLEDALRWIDHAGLIPALRAKDWRTFARGYNGAGQVTAYAAKLAAACRSV